MSKAGFTMPLESGDAWTRLRSKSFGRLAVSVEGQPDIFPVNFLANDSGILIRTEEGTKVERIAANDLVAFEVDDTNAQRAWSVVVKGSAHRMDDAELETARRAPLWTWEIVAGALPAQVSRCSPRIEKQRLTLTSPAAKGSVEFSPSYSHSG